MAFYGLRFERGDRILTAYATYASNFLAMLQVAKKTGAAVEVVPNDEFGQVSLDELRNRLDGSVKLIALTHVPTNGGLVNPAEEVGAIAREAGVPYLLDACQSAGQLPLDVEKIGCDFLSATGRKYLRGPRKSSLDHIEPPFIDLHAATWTGPDTYELQPDSRRFENWEGYVAGKIALGVAVEYALGWGVDTTWRRIQELAASLRRELDDIPGITVHDAGRVKGGIVTFAHESVDADRIREWLRTLNINVWTSTREYALLDAEARSLPKLVRASVHYYNSEEEIGRLAFAVRSIVGA
jgi:selenocysteine lyase/cysteine desulfurase